MAGVLALDVGTSLIKAARFDGELRRHTLLRRENTAVRADGTVDLEILAGAAFSLLREVTGAAVGGDAPVEVLAVSSFLGYVYLDRSLKPLAPGVSWAEASGQPHCAELSRRFAAWGQRLPRPVTRELLAPRLAALRGADGELYSSIWRVLGIKDYLIYLLTGEVATDIAHADYSLLLTPQGEENQPILDFLGLSSSPLPPDRLPQEIVGAVTAAGAEATGVAPGTPVVAGTSDGSAAMYGGGILSEGTVVVTCGTTDVAMTAVGGDSFLPGGTPGGAGGDAFGGGSGGGSRSGSGSAGSSGGAAAGAGLRSAGGLSVNRSAVEGLRLFGGSTGSSGGAYRWAVGRFGEQEAQRWESCEPGGGGLAALPGLSGERAPFDATGSYGALFGLREEHGGASITRALMEGATFRLTLLIERICALAGDRRDLALGGGGDTVALRGMRGALFPLPTRLLQDQELSLRGAALFGLAAVGLDSLTELSARAAQEGEPLPRGEAVPYRELYQRWLRLLPRLLGEEQG